MRAPTRSLAQAEAAIPGARAVAPSLNDQSGVSRPQFADRARCLKSPPLISSMVFRKASLAQPSPGSIAEAACRARLLSSPNPSAPTAEGPTAGSATGSTKWPSLSRFALRAHGPVGTASPRHLSRRRFRSKLDTVSSLTCSRPLVGSAFVEDLEACSHYVTRTTGLPRDILSPRPLHPYQPPSPPPGSSTGAFGLPNRVSRYSLDPRSVKPRTDRTPTILG
jgi:hypothetical protein